MDKSDLFAQANEQLKKVQIQINDVVADALIAFAIYPSIETKFNREYYRFDVIINDNEHHLFINGKGSDFDKYKAEILDIIKIEVLKEAE